MSVACFIAGGGGGGGGEGCGRCLTGCIVLDIVFILVQSLCGYSSNSSCSAINGSVPCISICWTRGARCVGFQDVAFLSSLCTFLAIFLSNCCDG